MSPDKLNQSEQGSHWTQETNHIGPAKVNMFHSHKGTKH